MKDQPIWSLPMIVLTIVLLAVPLVPFVMILHVESNLEDREWWKPLSFYLILVVYLGISYGGSCVYVVGVSGGFDVLSIQVQDAIVAVLGLVIFITVSLPFTFIWTKRVGVSMAVSNWLK